MKHLLSIQSLSAAEIDAILAATVAMKPIRGLHPRRPLAGQVWALIFSKSSTRTRVSFQVGVHELGGHSLFLSSTEIQLGRGEPIQDTARVVGRLVDGAIIRTYAQKDVEEFAVYAGIPTINALTDEEHPCQILADLFTIQEKCGSIQDRVVTFVGDGNCNVAISWLFAAARLGFELRIAAPPGFQPSAELLAQAGANVHCTDDVEAAVRKADVLYTDVWISMGKETEAGDRLQQLGPYQLNERLVKLARPGALIMHCLPAYRGNEIDEATFEANAQTIFDQAENRLHVQKVILDLLTTSKSPMPQSELMP
jgi:ornithine carbamoyltransferase